jgi:hypothetical protein
MIVLDDICKKCNEKCAMMHFQRNFDNWTSGNNDIDKLIQDTQLSAHNNAFKALEWIPYDRFYNIEYISDSNIGKVYMANWIDGSILCWKNADQNWKRQNQNMVVILESLDNSKNFIDEVF